MNKSLLFVVLLVAAQYLSAQNYQCVQQGVKRYFTNDDYYMRGMRIDSVKQDGAAVVLYPFHTPRGAYGYAVQAPHLDSTGGSWLGKTITVLPDGRHLFENVWQDTVVIAANAALGETWIFYNDTGSIFYEASIIAVDTMTVLGTLDSIKLIALTAKDQAGILPQAPAHGLQITLSKNHGFAAVADLCNFPYHAPDTAMYVPGRDYFLDGFGFINGRVAVFTLVDFVNARQQELTAHEVGDVLLYFGEGQPLMQYRRDSIIAKTVLPDRTVYTTESWEKKEIISYQNGPNPWLSRFFEGGIVARDVFVVDTLKMPEEWRVPMLYRYNPGDTSFCRTGTLYTAFNHRIVYDLLTINRYELCSSMPDETYKAGLGRVRYALCLDPTPGPMNSFYEQLVYRKTQQGTCGHYPSIVHAGELAMKPAGLKLYPNPASGVLMVDLPESRESLQISIRNVLGKEVYQASASGETMAIPLQNISPGVYTLSVAGQGGVVSAQFVRNE